MYEEHEDDMPIPNARTREERIHNMGSQEPYAYV
jgi:hypothetical protein